VREKCAGAWDVFFGLHGVDLVFGFVALVRNGEKTHAVDGRVSGAKPRNAKAHVVPGEVDRIGDEKEQSKRCGDAENQAGTGRRAISRYGHGIGLRRYFASGEGLEEARIEGIDRGYACGTPEQEIPEQYPQKDESARTLKRGAPVLLE
jgi:hypothetical protein